MDLITKLNISQRLNSIPGHCVSLNASVSYAGFTIYINKLICIVSLRKILYSLQRGSNHGPLALGASIRLHYNARTKSEETEVQSPL